MDQELFDKLQYLVTENDRKGQDSKSNFAQAWYYGKVAGLQEALIHLMDDDDFTLSMMAAMDSMHRAVQAVEKLYEGKE